MKIAILSFGGLVTKGSKLVKTKWSNKNTPQFPIEMCRVNKAGKLVLAISNDNGVQNNVYAAMAKSNNLNKAIASFLEAENIGEKQVGVIHLAEKMASERANQYKDLSRNVAEWARKNKIEAVIWNGLTKIFKDRIKVPFSVENAVNYVTHLEGKLKKEQETYLKNIPAGIITPVLDVLKEKFATMPIKAKIKAKVKAKAKKKV